MDRSNRAKKQSIKEPLQQPKQQEKADNEGAGGDGITDTIKKKWEEMNLEERYGANYKCFVGFFFVGVIFIILSLFMLPFIVLFPTRVASNFNIGAFLILIAFAIQKGWKKFFVDEMFCGPRPKNFFAIALVISMGLTLYMAMGAESYVGTIIFFIAEVIVMVYFVGCFFPGGTKGVSDFFSTIGGGLKKALCSCCGSKDK